MRKTIFRTFIAAALMSFCFSVPAFAENAVVTGTEVNLRSGPGTNYKIINCLAGGSSVQVTDCSNGSWYAVNYGSQSGYMAAAYISLSSDPFAGDLGSGTVITGGQSGQISGGLDLGGQGSGGQNGSSQSSQSNGYINAMYVRFRVLDILYNDRLSELWSFPKLLFNPSTFRIVSRDTFDFHYTTLHGTDLDFDDLVNAIVHLSKKTGLAINAHGLLMAMELGHDTDVVNMAHSTEP